MIILTFGLLVATGVGTVATFVQARVAVDAKRDAEKAQRDAEGAQEKAEAARDEALRLSKEANTALVRQAEAQELANRIALESAPRSDLKWRSTLDNQVDTVMDSEGDPIDYQALTLVITNRGSGVALDVQVSVVDAPSVGQRELGAIGLDGKETARFNLMANDVTWPGTFKITWRESPSHEFERIVPFGPGDTDEIY